MADERMKNDPNNQPFDGKRMIYADSRRSSTPDIPPFSRGRASNVAPNSRTPAPRRRETMTNPKGSFIWYELITSDPDGAARFYGAVVGWTIAAHSDPAACGVVYRMIRRSDGDRKSTRLNSSH